MKTIAELAQRVAGAARAQAAQYAGGQERPLGGYALTMSVYAGTVAALAAAVRARGKPVPDGLSVGDLMLCAASTQRDRDVQTQATSAVVCQTSLRRDVVSRAVETDAAGAPTQRSQARAR